MDLLNFTGSLVKKATNLLGLNSPESPKAPPLDGEIIYCKNNVCVHPPAVLSKDADHFPGYLNIRSQEDEVLGTTLILTWIPNNRLKKNPRSIENSPAHPKPSPHRRSPRPDFAKSDWSPATSLDSATSTPSSEGAEKVAREKKESSDFTSISSSEIPEHDPGGEKSQVTTADSGIATGPALDEAEQNNAINNAAPRLSHPKVLGLGQNVNDLHAKDINIKKTNAAGIESLNESSESQATSNVPNDSSPSSDSSSMSTQAKLDDLLSAKRHSSQEERMSQRSSQRSVTSIEMEGDKLLVVTEEMEDSPFTDEGATGDASNSVCCNVQGRMVNGGNGVTHVGDSLTESYMSSDSSCPSSTGHHYQDKLSQLQEYTRAKLGNNLEKNLFENSDKDKVDKLKQSLDLKLSHVNNSSQNCQAGIVSEKNESQCSSQTAPRERPSEVSPTNSSSTATSGPDSTPPSPITPPDYPFTPGSLGSSTSSLTATHNMTFPENSINFSKGQGNDTLSPKTAAEQVCGVFSVDIGQMRSLRIFYSNDSMTSGQLVIASRESQYKILHFHHGGLDKLADTFSDWKFLTTAKNKKKLGALCRQYSVIRPYKPNKHKHPEEGAYEAVNEETWHRHMNQAGQIQDDFHLRKAIFFAGLEPSLRHEMWPFLLHYHPYTSTHEEREQLRNDKFIAYQNIRKEREGMNEESRERFWRSVQCTVEKDVVRTDRSHAYFRGTDNPNIEILKNILLNYAVAHPHYGYTQGMSDLLAPVLAEVQNEADAYWCFVGLMQKTIFVSSPKDLDMDKQLNYLRELVRIMLPRFYKHLARVQDGMELLFVHRWILLCFKREFPETDALTMWEACWAHYQTDYFHLFICLAIISVYGEDVVQENLAADDMLLHFSSLSMHMNGGMVLRKARALMHQFRTRPKIPCTLEGLCTLCSSGMWDSGHVPTVVCIGNHPDGVDECPYGGRMSTSED